MINIYMSTNLETNFKNFIYSIASKYIRVKNLDVTVNEVVNAIYNDKFILNLIKNKNPNFKTISVTQYAQNHKQKLSLNNNKFTVSTYDNVVDINNYIYHNPNSKLMKLDNTMIDSVRLIYFNTYEEKHFSFFDVIFAGSPCKEGSLNYVEVGDSVKIPVLFYLQYLIKQNQLYADETIEYIGNQKEVIKYSKLMQLSLEKNIHGLDAGNTVNPIYVKYIHKGYLFLTCAFFDMNVKKTHIFSIKLKSANLNDTQSIHTLLNNTVNEFYKHLNIKINFNGGIDLIKLLQLYIGLLASDLNSGIISTFSSNLEKGQKEFIVELHDVFLDQNWSAKQVKEHATTMTDESDLILLSDNEYMIGEYTRISVYGAGVDSLIPRNMKNIIIPSFIGYQSIDGFPKFSAAGLDSYLSDPQKIRSPILNITGNHINYLSPLNIHVSSQDFIILSDVKENPEE